MGGWFEASKPADEQESYGRHSRYRLFAVPVAALLQEAVDEGRPLQLGWRGEDELEDNEREFPTAILPSISTDTNVAF